MNLRSVVQITLLSCSWCGTLAAQATVEGRVQLPKTKSITVVSSRYSITSEGGVLATDPPLAIVYLEGASEKGGRLPVKQITQRDLTFIPTLTAVQVGTTVEFPNEDDTYHNIFSYSPAKRFDLGRYRKEERPIPSVVFDKPGLVTLRCDIHEHMRALILVLETSRFVTSDPDGHFRLTGLPAGKYILKAWVDSRTTREKPIELKNGETVRVDFP